MVGHLGYSKKSWHFLKKFVILKKEFKVFNELSWYFRSSFPFWVKKLLLFLEYLVCWEKKVGILRKSWSFQLTNFLKICHVEIVDFLAELDDFFCQYDNFFSEYANFYHCHPEKKQWINQICWMWQLFTLKMPTFDEKLTTFV